MIYNKSTHPIEIKKISLRIWSLRDEIEAAIERRIKECDAAGIPLYIEDIKKFYNLHHFSEAANDTVTDLMESLSQEESPSDEAREIMAEQKLQGLDNTKPNPILDRPYQRQAPDLDKISYGFSLLNDINMDTFLSFTKNKFLHGQSVVIEFLIPQSFMVSAEVTYCHFYAMRSRIISSTRPDYRVQGKFNYIFSGERENLRSFLKSIEPDIPEKKRKDQDDSHVP